jgi:hypothetical protein
MLVVAAYDVQASLYIISSNYEPLQLASPSSLSGQPAVATVDLATQN